jgi:cysteine synthase
MTGLGRRLHEVNPNTKLIGVDPRGSVLAMPQTLNDFKGFFE